MEGGILESPETTLDRYDDEIALQACCSPKRRLHKFIGLTLMCLLGFGMIVNALLSLQPSSHCLYLIILVSVYYNLILDILRPRNITWNI